MQLSKILGKSLLPFLLLGCEAVDLGQYAVNADPAAAVARNPANPGGSPLASPSPTPVAGSSGFQGIAMVSPTCGGAIPADAPPDYCSAPYKGAFDVRSCAVLSADPLKGIGIVNPPYCDVVASFDSDEQGRFRVFIAPGSYFITLNNGVSGRFGLPGMEPVAVEVLQNSMAEINLNVDSGIRAPIAPTL